MRRWATPIVIGAIVVAAVVLVALAFSPYCNAR